jgi:glutamine cyclotransferase
VLRYNAATLALLGTAATQLKDGWGLASSGPGDGRLWATDGSATLSSLHPKTLRTVASVPVTDGGTPVRLLNELEVVGSAVWANIWLTDCIALIDGPSGHVSGYLLMHGLRGSSHQQGEDVLNGIAWDADGDRIFVTGKYWNHLYEVTIQPLLGGTPGERLARARAACVR